MALFGRRKEKNCLKTCSTEELKRELEDREDYDYIQFELMSYEGGSMTFRVFKDQISETRSELNRLFSFGFNKIHATFWKEEINNV